MNYASAGIGRAMRHGHLLGRGWHHLAPEALGAPSREILMTGDLRDAVRRLNPAVEAVDGRCVQVVDTLRAIVLGARDQGFDAARTEFFAWLMGNQTMPWGAEGAPVAVRIIEFDDVDANSWALATRLDMNIGGRTFLADMVLFVNGIPLVVVVIGDPDSGGRSVEERLPELFVPNLFVVVPPPEIYAAATASHAMYPPGAAGVAASDETGVIEPIAEEVCEEISAVLDPAAVLEALARSR
jgi:type I restriction enzyme R subunit